MKRKTANSAAVCPCGSGQLYASCCGRYHRGQPVPSAEALMRSRYSAFVLGDEGYLRQSWAAENLPDEPLLDAAVKWLGLSILSTEAGGEQDQTGVVTFIARYKINGRAGRMQESSRFVREQGLWRYLDGDVGDVATS
ncbi:YchJ family protein [Vogesella indigofera]|uniref:YchJ family protein n=1 Tax=Vogesella indigofera TaxID=45465 RepID=UPI00234F6746|nr:YchJ family protein [Vogesella indigofera]MDC7701449.1 YchJ family protein [Vogesella indigofera]